MKRPGPPTAAEYRDLVANLARAAAIERHLVDALRRIAGAYAPAKEQQEIAREALAKAYPEDEP